MADVGLGRPDVQRVGLPKVRTDRPIDGPRLDRVALLGARAMGLEEADLFGLDVGLPEDLLQQKRLLVLARRDDADGAAIVADAAVRDDGEDVVVVGLGLGQRLEDHAPGALASGVARLGALVKRVSLAGVREQAQLAHGHPDVGLRDQVRGAHDGLVRLARPDALHGQVEGVHAGRASRVDGQGRARHVEEVRQPAGEESPLVAGGVEGRDVVQVPQVAHAVLAVVGPDEDSHLGLGDGLFRDARVLQCFVRAFEQQPLCRVWTSHVSRWVRKRARHRRHVPIDSASFFVISKNPASNMEMSSLMK